MAVQHGVPGEWARVRGTVLSLWPLFAAFACMGAFLAALATGAHTLFFAILFLVSLAAAAALWRNGVRRVASFFVGARGEERVAGMLAALPERYHVFHDFVADGTHVDHVVVGPAGVFSVETKNWRGKVTLEEGRHVLVDGRLADRAPLKQALREAGAVEARFAKAGWTGQVTPVLCFASGTFERPVAEAGSVVVANADALCAWMLARPETVAPDELERLVGLVEAM